MDYDVHKTHYIACVTLKEIKHPNDGNIMQAADEVGWLGDSDGYPQVYREASWAKQFDSPEEARDNVKSWQGMPWWCKFDPKTLKVWKVDTTVNTTIVEV